MPIIVEIAGTGETAEFPDGTPPEVMQQALAGLSQPQQARSAIPQGIPGISDSPVAAPFAQESRLQAAVEPLATLGSGIIAEPVAGIGGALSQAGRSMGLDLPSGGDAVNSIRELMTFQPRTDEGKQILDAIGGIVKGGVDAANIPVSGIGGLIESAATLDPSKGAATVRAVQSEGVGKASGQFMQDLTGSPALAAFAETIPTAIETMIGVKVGRGGRTRPQKVQSPAKVKEGQVSKAIVESAPEISQLKDVSRSIYKEIDDLGVTIEPKAYDQFVRKILGTAKGARVNKNRTPKAFGAAQEFAKELKSSGSKSILDIDDLRAVAQDAASSIDPADARIGMMMIDDIDSFLDTAPASTFKGKNAAQAAQVGERYKAARNLWGRARRAELIEDAFTKADRQASGFENGLRTQLRQIVNNKKQKRFFTKDEIAAMDDVIKGTSESNALKLVGRLGFSEGGATNVLGGLAGSAVLGPTAPIIGQISRKLAQRATKKGFDMADAIIRAGPNGKKITEAYLQVTPTAKRSASELSELLTNPDIDLKSLLDSSNKLVKEAAEVARGRRALNAGEAIGALAPAAQTQQDNQ